MYYRKSLGDVETSGQVESFFATTGQDVSPTPTHEMGVSVSSTNAPPGLFVAPQSVGATVQSTLKGSWLSWVALGMGAWWGWRKWGKKIGGLVNV